MNEEPMPGDDASDRELARRWQQSSVEEPSAATDARIRAAAREAQRVAAPSVPGVRWRRIAPLAAAASVAVLAVGLIRLMPPEERRAIPAAELAARDSALPATPARRGDAESNLAQPPTPQEAPLEALPKLQLDRAPAVRAESARTTEAAKEVQPEATPSPAAADAADARTSEEAGLARPSPTTAITTTTEHRALGASQAIEPAPGVPERTVIAALPPELAARVQRDAAGRTGLEPGSIHILVVEPVASRDPALGCHAEPALADSAAEATGYVVTVDAAGTTLRYHTDGRDQLRFCDDE
jgi:hypothetical protein